MRIDGADALSRRPDFEIVAVRTLRNSLMSAAIGASAAALALMGTIARAGSGLVESMAALRSGHMQLHTVLDGPPMRALFASYVCPAMAMRHFNHAGFVMSMPADSEQRKPLDPRAREYVERACRLNGWGLRFFLMVATLAGGIVNPLAMPPITVVRVVVLRYFDRPVRLTR